MKKTRPFGYLATVLLVSSLIFLPLASISDVGSAQAPEDLEFLGWYNTTIAKIETDTINMASAIENYDCTTAEAWAGSGYEDATKALDEIGGYEVSSEMQPVKDHLTLALEDFKLACDHTELGAMMYDADELETAARYVESSLGHFEEIDEIGLVPATPVAALSRLQGNLEQAVQTLRSSKTPTTSPTPTPKTPSYEAIIAVGGLLAVACLMLRRR